MRKLITSDVFKFAKIIKLANAKEEIKSIFSKLSDENMKEEELAKLQKEAGIEFVAFLIESCGSDEVEKAIYSFLAGVSEKEADVIKNQSIEETIDMIKKIASENNLQNFLSIAVKSA